MSARAENAGPLALRTLPLPAFDRLAGRFSFKSHCT